MLKNISGPFLVLAILLSFPVVAQIKTNKAILRAAAQIGAAKQKAEFKDLLELAKKKSWVMMRKEKSGRLISLRGIDPFGYPIYTATDNTLQSAATIGTNQLWAGGNLGLSLSGSSNNMKDKLALWDGGGVLSTHIELTGRILQNDNPGSPEDHSTHVAGILINTGLNAQAKGMAFGLQELLAYDYDNDVTEMQDAVVNYDLLVSNHSYSTIAGWNQNENENNRWEFSGRVGENEDYNFGRYDGIAEGWDDIAYNAPFYLIVKAAGNNRNVNGPAVGEPYYRPNSSGEMVFAGNRQAGISSNDSYDIMSTYGCAKNILTVGAVEPIPYGYSQPSNVVMTSFSSWGPTDDGRIKPDVVADGVAVLSSFASSNNSYGVLNGTSMSAPAVAGSALLLQEYYSQLHNGAFMRSATLKGIIIHTADEAGDNPGPDYRFGWGLVDIAKSAELIKTAAAANSDKAIYEDILNNGGTVSIPVVASGKGSLVATICWTDPKASQQMGLDDATRRLINDLDIRVKKGSTTYLPWILAPGTPSAAATKGDNIRDNVEKIEIPNAVPGDSYTIEITHKGTLQGGQQAYSLIVSGVGGTAYCTNSLSGGPRFTNVQIGSGPSNAFSDCVTYRQFTADPISLYSGQIVTLNLGLGDCNTIPTLPRIVKVFIDYNNDGDFADEGEMMISASLFANSYTPSFTIPNGLTPGFSTRMRIEVSNNASITGCGDADLGETQDYLVNFIKPAKDLASTGLAYPAASICASSGNQLVSVKIKNEGTEAQSNIAVISLITQGSTVITTLNEVYRGTINAGEEAIFTFRDPVNFPAGNSTITTTIFYAGDVNEANNEHVDNIVVNGNMTPPTGLSANECSNTVRLKIENPTDDVIVWYPDNITNNPIATGNDVVSSTLSGNGKYYAAFNDLRKNAGMPSKSLSTIGTYDALNGNAMKFTTYTPLTIETVKLYIGNPGKVRFTIGKPVDETHYQLISSNTINVYATDPTPTPSAQTNVYESGDEGAYFLLDLPVPEPGDYLLIMECIDGATLFYNSGINTNPYPITIPGIFSVTGNNAKDRNNPDNITFYQRFYLGVYDIKLRLSGCASDLVEVDAENCDQLDIDLGPNPNDGNLNLKVEAKELADLHINVFNLMGLKVYSATYPNVTGHFATMLNLRHLQSGVYLVRIEHNGKKYTRKIILYKN